MSNRLNMENYFIVLLGFLLDFYAFSLIFAFGLHSVLEGRKKTNEIQKQYSTGIGNFFMSISASSMVYGVDLTAREFFGARIFPARAEFEAMGFVFDSLHMETYFILILVFLLLAVSSIMKPIEKYVMNRPKAIISKIALVLSPLPIIIRILELIFLPLEGDILYYVFFGLFGIIWLIIAISVFLIVGLYLKIAIKSAGDIRKRSFAVVVSIIIWLVTIFQRPNFLKDMDNDPETFWLIPLIVLVMLACFVYGFSESMELQSKLRGHDHIYSYWFFKVIVIGFAALVAVFLSRFFWYSDLDWVIYLEGQAAVNTWLDNFANFMDQSIFDDGGIGGQDLVYFALAPFVIIYFLQFIPKIKERFKDSQIFHYCGYIIVSIIVLVVVNREFKTFFGRDRPGSIINFTPMWMIGTLDISDGFSHGSFTSGHTTSAVLLVVFAFLAIRTHKKLIVALISTVTLAIVVIMGFGRVLHGSHYPGDVLWAAFIGVSLLTWLYFMVLKIPQQEERAFRIHANFGEFRWGFCFIFFSVGVTACALGIKYLILEPFEWYWVAAAVVGPIIAFLFYKRMNFLIHGPKSARKTI
jgi:membrane-associated phospholipid phosphatase